MSGSAPIGNENGTQAHLMPADYPDFIRSCYALWPRQIENSHHLPVGFAADNADVADFRGFFGLKKDFSAKIRDDPIFQRHPRRIERRMI